MTFRRQISLPFCLILLAGVAAAACGDDDDGGGTTTPPTTNVDAGRDGAASGDGGGGGGGDAARTDATTSDATNNQDSGTAPAITTPAALASIVGGVAAAAVQLAATGDTPITWAITSGAAPPGMTLSAAGEYAGTPTAAGTFTFTVTATNAAGTATLVFTQVVTSPAADALLLVDGSKLSTVATAFPGGASAPTTLTGVLAGDVLVSMDRRPQNGFLYALGFNATNATLTLYAVHPEVGTVVAIGPATSAAPAAAFAGPSFALDFNPQVDLARVVSSSGQNFRFNPNNGLPVDTDLNVNGIQRDGDINGGSAASGSAVAYTNNSANTTLTTLYTISGSTLHIQNPPNGGTLTTPLPLTGVESVFGLDIPQGVNATLANNPPAAGSGIAALKLTGAPEHQLASIDLVTGALGVRGKLPFVGVNAIALNKTAVRPIVALTSTGSLLRFSDDAPATTTPRAVQGVAAGETLVGMDYRPATGQLYALGVNAILNVATLYLVNPQTGDVTIVSPNSLPGQIGFTTNGIIPVDLPDPATTGYGFDFNSSVDRIRVTTASGLNFRVHPNTGVGIDGDNGTPAQPVDGTNTDGNLSGGVLLDGVAYTNGHPATLPGVTTEYGLDSATNSLHVVTSPNVGTVGTAIPVTIGGSPLDFTVCGFDIPSSVAVTANNTPVTAGSGYAALTVGGATNLYQINLVSGAATLIGSIGAGTTQLVSIAVGQ